MEPLLSLLAVESDSPAGVAGWIIGGIGALFGIIAAWQKAQLQTKNTELDYLFNQFKLTVDRVRAEHDTDKKKLEKREEDYLRISEEAATLKERNANLERELTAMKGQKGP